MKSCLFVLLVFAISGVLTAQQVLLSEDFAHGLPDSWTVDTDGKRAWEFKTYRDATYMLMSAYDGKGKKGLKVKTALYSPLLDLSGKECSLRFAMANAFANGQPLRILLYTAEKKPSLEFAKSHFESLIDNPDFYNNIYQSSPWIPLPQQRESMHLAFVYDTKKVSATTTLQIAEVDVWCTDMALKNLEVEEAEDVILEAELEEKSI